MYQVFCDGTDLHSVDVLQLYCNSWGMKKMIPLSDIIHVIDDYYWDHGTEKITPRQVLVDPVKYADHFSRIKDADLSYPIMVYEKAEQIAPNIERRFVIDGIHRVCKACLNGNTQISVIYIPQEIMAMTFIGKANEPNRYSSITSPVSHFVSLYNIKVERNKLPYFVSKKTDAQMSD
jgi:hypothetical protein